MIKEEEQWRSSLTASQGKRVAFADSRREEKGALACSQRVGVVALVADYLKKEVRVRWLLCDLLMRIINAGGSKLGLVT
jgi:hypothetical protein